MLDRLRPYLRATSWPIIVAMLALMGLSLLAVRAAELADPGSVIVRGATARQGLWIAVALVGFVVATIVPFQRVGRWAYVLFALNLVLLVAVLLLPAVRGSHRWIRIGPVNFQPSELAKLTYILALAWYLRYRENFRRLRGFIPPFALTLVPAVLVLVEPDLGTTLLLFPTLGAKGKHLLGVVGVVAVIAFLPVPYRLDPSRPAVTSREKLAYWTYDQGKYALVAAPFARLPFVDRDIMKPHQIRRIEGWLRQSDPAVANDQGFQLHQSMMVLGSGGANGNSQSEAVDMYIRWLPDDHTDFIYAVIGGQWGFKGCAGLILIYIAIFVCGAEVAAVTSDPFGRLLVIGVLALLFTQIFINVGMTIGLMPITGMTLPLVSFGGSSMLINAIALGLLVNVGQRRPMTLSRKPFEHGGKTPEQQAAYKRPMDRLEGP